jgi:NADH dehydrogenase FAD-containing subunit
VVEAGGHLLGSFHSSIVEYVETIFKNRKIELLTGIAVKKVKDNVACLSDGKELPFGLMVWSTGIKQVRLIREISGVAKAKTGRLIVNNNLKVLD